MDSKITEEQAEKSVLDFVSRYTKAGLCPLAGNSVHVDRTFLKKYMPKFDDHLHYRIVDVSTVKELCRFGKMVQSEHIFVTIYLF